MGHIDHVEITFATTGYVDERVKKLEERIEALEAKLARQDLREIDQLAPYRQAHEFLWYGSRLDEEEVQPNVARAVMEGVHDAFNGFKDTAGRFKRDKVYRFTLTFTEEDPHEEAQP